MLYCRVLFDYYYFFQHLYCIYSKQSFNAIAGQEGPNFIKLI